VILVHNANELPRGNRKVCVAIGVFDGVHLGHQQVIRQTVSDARQHNALAVIVTFDCHPNTVVAPDRVPPQIYSLAQKLRVLESTGADATLLIHFDKAFSLVPAEEFIRGLARSWEYIHGVCVGDEFTFGHKRSGNVSLLKSLGAELNFFVHGLAAVSLNGQVVSSTRIREAIAGGDLDAASQMLGRAYSFAGKIVPGNQVGGKLGFPTANLNTEGLLLPPNGVYAAQVLVNGRSHPAALNIGHRPTLANPLPRLQVEAHLLDFSGDLYGLELEITPVEKLRNEQRFDSLASLKAQIARDVDRARQLLG
jgi:riboflavin kinase/FMN adenylyltransferase